MSGLLLGLLVFAIVQVIESWPLTAFFVAVWSQLKGDLARSMRARCTKRGTRSRTRP